MRFYSIMPAAKALASLRLKSNFKKYFLGYDDIPDIFGGNRGTRLGMKISHIARLKLAENVRHRIRLCMIHDGLDGGLVFTIH